MSNQQYNQELLAFIHNSPTPFHAVNNIQMELESGGFIPLVEEDSWNVVPGGRYYVTRNGSSIIAFVMGYNSVTDSGIRMVGAHTDSPCLKVKPKPELHKHNYFQLGVEVYGGALLNPWFDRDLSMDMKKPVAVIPSLAIHLDSEANSNRKINSQTDIPPILFKCGENREEDFRALMAAQLLGQYGDPMELQVLDYDLYLYDCQKPAITGLNEDFDAHL